MSRADWIFLGIFWTAVFAGVVIDRWLLPPPKEK